MNEQLKVGALFSGIGGFCLGFEREGLVTNWAVENDEDCVKTYRANLPDVEIISSNDKPSSILDIKSGDLDPVDVLTAGFPCQSFSAAGDRRGFDDPRGQLFFEVIRLVQEFKDRKPSVLVLENSPYLRLGDGGSWFIEVLRQIKKAGYWFRESNTAELDTYDFTVLPQQRNRLFMVAFSIDHFRNGKFTFPNKHNDEPKDLSKFINFKGELTDDYYYLPEDNRYHKMISSEKDNMEGIYQLRKFLVRTKAPNVCPTLTANMGEGGHNVPFVFDKRGLRKLTEYECLALQGFDPKKFVFPEDVLRSRRYKQIGNSVSVPIAELLAKAVKSKIVQERRG